MNLDAGFGVSEGKVASLRDRIRRLGIVLTAIEERFVKGGGPGGSKINASASCVQLAYPPLGIQVRCQRERSLGLNRFLALRELVDRIEERLRPGESDRAKRIAKLRERKGRAGRRARARHRDGGAGGPATL
jgi:protein subunit release factor B